MKRFVQLLILAIGLIMLLVAALALAYSVGPVERQTEQVRPPATVFAPPQ